MAIEPAARGRNPFDTSGAERGPDGVARYTNRPGSLVEMLHATVERAGDRLAVAEIGGDRLTYRELWDHAARVAGGLRAEGVEPGDRVAIRLPNGLDWVLAFWGSQLAGAVVVPVNTRFKDSEAQYVIDDSGASYVFGPLPSGDPTAVENLGADDLAAIFYTSGTTGFPKGAMTSHANFLSNSENAVRCVGIDRDAGEDHATIINVPLFHVTGCNSQLVLMHELGGCAYVLSNPLDAEGFLRTASEERVDMLTSVPAIYHALTRHPAFTEADLDAVKFVSYGGAPIAAGAVEQIMRAFPQARVGNGFGLTETSSLTSFLPHEEAAEHADSVGFAMPVCDLAIDEPDPETGVGELLVRGPNVVRGYWNKPDATAETFADGWLHTGDLGRVDDDGLLYIVDRKKDMINRGGENVYSIEVERALAGAPGVAESAAVGVPDEMMGEKVGAVIVPASEGSVDVDSVISHVRKRLADFKVPQYVAVREEPLPRNPGGKVLKAELRDETEWGEPPAMNRVVPFRDRSPVAKVFLAGVLPAAIGALAGVMLGVSAGAYWAVGAIAAIGGLLAGFEHSDDGEAIGRGAVAGAIYGAALLIAHAIAGTDAKVSLGGFPPVLILITAIIGAVLAVIGERITRRRR